MKKLLLNAVIATDATKVAFKLRSDNFKGDPILRGAGLGVGDSCKLYYGVKGTWVDSGLVLSDSVLTLSLKSLGTYAIDVTMVTVGPVSVELEASGLLV